MKKIVMPKPCTEDWTKMTPTEKGAYCKKCELEVVDFTQKSAEEIRATLIANAGNRTCGHISKSQMEMINSDFHLWDNQPVSVFRSKFLYACMMAFGMTLFTGCDFLNGEEYEVGDVGMVDEVVDGGMMVEDDSTATCDGTEMVEGEMEFDADDIKVGTVVYDEAEMDEEVTEVKVGKMQIDESE